MYVRKIVRKVVTFTLSCTYVHSQGVLKGILITSQSQTANFHFPDKCYVNVTKRLPFAHQPSNWQQDYTQKVTPGSRDVTSRMSVLNGKYQYARRSWGMKPKQSRAFGIIWQAVPNGWTQYTITSSAVRRESLTGGTVSWLPFMDQKQYPDDKLCDAGWEHNSDG